jgi:hypothetical protein
VGALLACESDYGRSLDPRLFEAGRLTTITERNFQMANFIPHAGSSRLIKTQNLNWTGTGVLQSTTFASMTNQIRCIAQTAGYIAVVNSTAESITPTTAAGSGMLIAANTASGDYLTCNPGQFLCYASTTTSTVAPIVNVCEFS